MKIMFVCTFKTALCSELSEYLLFGIAKFLQKPFAKLLSFQGNGLKFNVKLSIQYQSVSDDLYVRAANKTFSAVTRNRICSFRIDRCNEWPLVCSLGFQGNELKFKVNFLHKNMRSVGFPGRVSERPPRSQKQQKMF